MMDQIRRPCSRHSDSALTQHATAVTLTAIPTSVFGASVIAAYQRAGVPIIVGAEAPVPPPSKEVYGDADGPATFQEAAKVVAAWFVATQAVRARRS